MVTEVEEEHNEDVMIMINHIMIEIATTNAKKSRDYETDSDSLAVDFPVEEWAINVDKTQNNNIDMERLK